MTMSAHSPNYQEAINHAHQVANYAQNLTTEEQAQLLDELTALAEVLRKRLAVAQTQTQQQPRKRRGIMQYEGMAKDVWAGINVEEYIKEERASWDKEDYRE